MKGNSMNKKVLFILPVLVMLLAGCNKAEDKASPVESEQTTTSESTSTSSQTSSQESSSEGTSSEQTSSEETSSEEQSSEQASSEETSSEETSSQEQSSEEQSSEQSSSEESSSSEEQVQHVVAISVGGNSTNLTLNEDATLDTEHGQLAELNGSLTSLVKGQEVVFSLDGNPIVEHIGSDQEDAENKNLVQGEVGHFVIHNDAATSDVTFKVYETGYCFWLTGYVADAPIEDSFKLFVKRGENMTDYDMTKNTEKEHEYYYKDLELEANDEVVFCITLDEVATWYHFDNVKAGAVKYVEESAPYIHGEEEDPRSDGNLVIKEAGTYDFYVDTVDGIWIEKQLDPGVEYVTIYFRDAQWWNKDAASTNYLAFTGEQPSGIGNMMSHIKYVEANHYNYWSCQVPTTAEKIVFFRTGNGGADDWGARTVVITLADRGENNMYDISETEAAWYGEGHSITGDWATYAAE